MVANILSRYWWMTLLRGVIWVLFGICVLAQPGISLITLTFLFGGFALADGIVKVGSAIGGRNEHEHWGVLLLAGLCGIGIGILTFISPGLTALALLFYIAVWAIATGLMELVVAIRLRKEIEGEFWLGLAGVASITFGVLLMARPGAGALSVLAMIGGFAIVIGLLEIILAIRARGFVSRLREATRAA